MVGCVLLVYGLACNNGEAEMIHCPHIDTVEKDAKLDAGGLTSCFQSTASTILPRSWKPRLSSSPLLVTVCPLRIRPIQSSGSAAFRGSERREVKG